MMLVKMMFEDVFEMNVLDGSNCGVRGARQHGALLTCQALVAAMARVWNILGEGDRHCGRPWVASREWCRGFASATLGTKSW